MSPTSNAKQKHGNGRCHNLGPARRRRESPRRPQPHHRRRLRSRRICQRWTHQSTLHGPARSQANARPTKGDPATWSVANQCQKSRPPSPNRKSRAIQFTSLQRFTFARRPALIGVCAFAAYCSPLTRRTVVEYDGTDGTATRVADVAE
jgi:hypothetical protein